MFISFTTRDGTNDVYICPEQITRLIGCDITEDGFTWQNTIICTNDGDRLTVKGDPATIAVALEGDEKWIEHYFDGHIITHKLWAWLMSKEIFNTADLDWYANSSDPTATEWRFDVPDDIVKSLEIELNIKLEGRH